MKRARPSYAFTVIEILVALSLMVIILSALYGSFTAVTQATQVCRARTDVTRQTCRTLHDITALMRGLVPPSPTNTTTSSIAKQSRLFHSPSLTEQPHTLTLITQYGLTETAQTTIAPFQTSLRYIHSTGELYIWQRPFMGQPVHPDEQAEWVLLLDHIQDLTWALYDGTTWHSSWERTPEDSLPHAIQLDLVVRDETQHSRHYQVTAYPLSRPEERPVKKGKSS